MRPAADFKPLGGKLVLLRPRSRELLEDFYVKRFQAEVLEWADVWPKEPSFEEVRLRFHEQERSSKEWRLWIHTMQGKLIGEVSLFDIDQVECRAEFGIVLFDTAYWGRGYGTEAAGLFLYDAVKRFNLDSVYLFTALDNKRAIRSFEKLGFRITERLMLEKDRFVRMEAQAVALTDG
jgi:RimJ/RimL family protein N-acetyltransferase